MIYKCCTVSGEFVDSGIVAMNKDEGTDRLGAVDGSGGFGRKRTTHTAANSLLQTEHTCHGQNAYRASNTQIATVSLTHSPSFLRGEYVKIRVTITNTEEQC